MILSILIESVRYVVGRAGIFEAYNVFSFDAITTFKRVSTKIVENYPTLIVPNICSNFINFERIHPMHYKKQRLFISLLEKVEVQVAMRNTPKCIPFRSAEQYARSSVYTCLYQTDSILRQDTKHCHGHMNSEGVDDTGRTEWRPLFLTCQNVLTCHPLPIQKILLPYRVIKPLEVHGLSMLEALLQQQQNIESPGE